MSKLFSPVIDLADRALIRFDGWFASRTGVWQTAIATVGLVVFEALFPNVDPHGFWLLFYLTVYSAVTQPALAHTGQESAKRLESLEQAILTHIEAEDADIKQIRHDVAEMKLNLMAHFRRHKCTE